MKKQHKAGGKVRGETAMETGNVKGDVKGRTIVKWDRFEDGTKRPHTL